MLNTKYYIASLLLILTDNYAKAKCQSVDLEVQLELQTSTDIPWFRPIGGLKIYGGEPGSDVIQMWVLDVDEGDNSEYLLAERVEP